MIYYVNCAWRQPRKCACMELIRMCTRNAMTASPKTFHRLSIGLQLLPIASSSQLNLVQFVPCAKWFRFAFNKQTEMPIRSAERSTHRSHINHFHLDFAHDRKKERNWAFAICISSFKPKNATWKTKWKLLNQIETIYEHRFTKRRGL